VAPGDPHHRATQAGATVPGDGPFLGTGTKRLLSISYRRSRDELLSQTPGLAVAILCCTWPVQAADRWYLLAPPFSSFEDSSGTGAVRVLADAPLAKWTQVGTFDNAQACEQSRQETIRFLTREDQNPTFSAQGAMLNRDRSLLTKCVASDDPRLK
jgi:hypothetical protein